MVGPSPSAGRGEDPWVLAFYHQNELRYVEPGNEAEISFTGAGLRKGPVKIFPETSEAAARAWLAQ